MCHSQNHFHSYFVLRESMPKMLLIVDPFVLNLNGLMPVLRQILSLLFWHRFFLLIRLMLLLPEWRQIWMYTLVVKLNANVPKSTKQCQVTMWKMTHACPNVFPSYCAVIWFDAWQLVQMKKWLEKKLRERESRMAKVINHFNMSLSLCVGCTISVRPVCRHFFWFGCLVWVYDSFPVLFKFKSI